MYTYTVWLNAEILSKGYEVRVSLFVDLYTV